MVTCSLNHGILHCYLFLQSINLVRSGHLRVDIREETRETTIVLIKAQNTHLVALFQLGISLLYFSKLVKRSRGIKWKRRRRRRRGRK